MCCSIWVILCQVNKTRVYRGGIMKHCYITIVLIASALLLSAGLSWAVEGNNNDDEPHKVVSKSTEKSKNARSEFEAKRKAAAKIKRVNINNATRMELKNLPGIGDAEAVKIIAGRPYGSKAWLVTNNIIGRGVYEKIKNLIDAGKPYSVAGKKAENDDKNKQQ